MASLPPDAREVYVADDPAEDEPRARKHRLVRETKRVVEQVAMLDPAATGVDVLDRLADEVADLADRLEMLPSLRDRGGLAMSGGPDGAIVERSGISGRSNPLAAPVHLSYDGDVARGWAVYTDDYEGPPGCLHGGFVAAAFDDLMGFAQLLSGSAGFTGTLVVKMLEPTPLRERIDYVAWVDRVDGRKIWCKAESRTGDTLLAEAEIVFIAPRQWPFE